MEELNRKLDILSLQVQLILSRGISGASDPSPTPATLGALAVETISEFNAHFTVSRETFPGATDVDPFLNADEMVELRNTSFSNESDLVKWFEPRFRRLMDTASADVGFKMILLNTERHPWVLCPQRGASSQPDGVGIAAELASLRVTDGDLSYQNHGDTNFGRLANWVLRDSIEFLSEWKVGQSFNQGLAEGIEYHRRINSSFVSDRQLQESTKKTKLDFILYDVLMEMLDLSTSRVGIVPVPSTRSFSLPMGDCGERHEKGSGKMPPQNFARSLV